MSTPGQKRRTLFVSVSLTPAARGALNRAALGLGPAAGRRVSMSDVALSAVRVAMRHKAELVADLTGHSR